MRDDLAFPSSTEELEPRGERRLISAVACGVSIVLHVVVFLVLAAWLTAGLPEDPVLDSMGTELVDSADDDGAMDDSKLFEMDEPAPEDPLEVLEIETVDPAKIVKELGDLKVALPGDLAAEALGKGTGSGGGVGFFGTRAAGNTFVFVVDCSGSMGTNHRLLRAKGELLRALQSLTSSKKYLVIFYNSNTLPLYQPPKRGLINATPRALRATKDKVHMIRHGGGTQPAQAVALALGLKPDVVFFLTDGEIPANTLQVARKFNRSRTVIHTVALGYRGGEPLMKQIAKENRGRYRFVP